MNMFTKPLAKCRDLGVWTPKNAVNFSEVMRLAAATVSREQSESLVHPVLLMPIVPSASNRLQMEEVRCRRASR